MVTDLGPGAPSEGVTGPSAPRELAAPITSGPRRPHGAVGRFFAAMILSLYGDWLSTVGLVVVLYQLTGSPVGPAGYVLARVAPRVLGPWWGGGLADRVSPRLVMVLAAVFQSVFTASLISSHRLSAIWAIYVAVAAAQFAGALGRPSQGAILPTLVDDRNLARANATYGLLLSSSIFVAPAIGAALLLRVGPDPLFAIDAATFVISAILVATLPNRRGSVRRNPSPKRPRTFVALRLAVRHPAIRVVAAANFANGLTVTVTQALLVVAAHERFGSDAAVGYLYASVGVGGALGGLVALRWIPSRLWTRLGVFVAVIVEVVALAGFGASTATLLALLLLAISASAGSSLDTWGITEVQRQAPPGLMGRYNSIIFISMYSGMLVGAVWALATSSVLHWDVAIEAACAAMLVLVGLVWISGGSSAPERKEP